MSESRQVAILFLLTITIAALGAFLLEHPPALSLEDVWIDSYDATIYPNGTLVEEYIYNVAASGKYRMLYRAWDVPLSQIPLGTPHVSLLSCEVPPGAIPYFRDASGEVWVPPSNKSPSVLSFISSNAEINEVGIYAPSYFEAGTYRVQYVFSIYPPIEYDSSDVHLNLMLADQHLDYRNVFIRVAFPEFGAITQVYARPLTLRLLETDEWVYILGSAEKDQILEVELLLSKDALSGLQGFPREVQGVRDQTEQANLLHSIQFRVASGLRDVAKGLALAMPFLILGIYLLYGREKRYPVPKYLSFVPNASVKPWVANLVFRDDPFVFDENGLYATILDLSRQGKLKIEGDGTSIRILETTSEDRYERLVLEFLSGISEDGLLDLKLVRNKVEKMASSGSYSSLNAVKVKWALISKYSDNSVANRYVAGGRRRLIPLLIVSLAALFTSIVGTLVFEVPSSLFLSAAGFSFLALLQTAVALAFPSSLFGRWKSEYYREKLEWDAFRNFLADLVMMKKYAPQDLLIWGEWLVYGTALGVGDNVARAMNELKIDLPDTSYLPGIRLIFRPIVHASVPQTGSGRAGSFGGGFGGGGFGGGGAGAR
ncbi:MAG: DUF2207 domain-containing protein [Candidatus Methanosuratus sp.]|nr:DUF2207 domain-containing protein [Candidatus Methanosuratincola sp.]